MEIPLSCSLCGEFLEDQFQITFSCNHKICKNCFPYIFFDHIHSKLIEKSSFFSSKEYAQNCIFCEKGFVILSYDRLFHLKSKINEVQSSSIHSEIKNCEICEENEEAKQYCFDCKKFKFFCDEHMAYVHKPLEKSKHLRCTIEEYNKTKPKETQSKKFLCNCSERLEVMFYCKKDQKWICKCCAKSEHEGHPNIPFANLTEYVKTSKKSFQKFEKNMMTSMNNIIENHKSNMLQTFDQIINLASTLKEKIVVKCKDELAFRKSQFSLIKNTLSSLCKDVENSQSVHPNKRLRIQAFSNLKKNETFNFKDYQINSEVESLKETMEIISLMGKMKTRIEKDDFEIIKFTIFLEDKRTTELNDENSFQIREENKGDFDSFEIKQSSKASSEAHKSEKTDCILKEVKKDEEEQNKEEGKRLFGLGEKYFLGKDGETKNEVKAVIYFDQAAKFGHVESIRRLGYCSEHGYGIEKNEKKAVEFYKKAADIGNIQAMNDLGYCYRNGYGCEKNEKKAVELYKTAADRGNAQAIFNLALCLDNGWGCEKNEKEAVKLYERASNLGNASAITNLGNCFLNGLQVEQDEKKAVELYEKAANMGHAGAIRNLGFCLENGYGCEQNQKKAINLYIKAVNLGNVPAMYNLGLNYKIGAGCGKDLKKAREFFEKAAKLGHDKDN